MTLSFLLLNGLIFTGDVGRWVPFVLYILFLLVFWLVELGFKMFFCLDDVILEIVLEILFVFVYLLFWPCSL